ncbi:hypothetical protein ISP17_09710 [Dyella ginsengisoli]|jgi:hypothetical protein|uniref:Uncharacterized protein n=1 Tax=Dyella ginsengisoli TaxID=363848 RepID=A0ABW8JT05_9GAMM
MNHWKCFVAMILLLSSGAAAAQQKMSQPEANQQLLDQANQQAAFARGMTFGDRYNEHWHKGMISLPQARKSLAEEWQKLGLSPELAKQVAATYRGDSSAMLNHPPLEGRSEKEVSAMIQQALTAKHYPMANRLLIDYERQRLNLEPMSAQVPTH